MKNLFFSLAFLLVGTVGFAKGGEGVKQSFLINTPELFKTLDIFSLKPCSHECWFGVYDNKGKAIGVVVVIAPDKLPCDSKAVKDAAQKEADAKF